MRGAEVAALALGLGVTSAGCAAAAPPARPAPIAAPAPAVAPRPERLPLEDLALRGDARCADGRLLEASWFVSDLRYTFTRAVVYRDGRLVVAGDGAGERRLGVEELTVLLATAAAARLDANEGRYQDDPFQSPSWGGAVASCVAGDHRAVEWHVGGAPRTPPVPKEAVMLHEALRAEAGRAQPPAREARP